MEKKEPTEYINLAEELKNPVEEDKARVLDVSPCFQIGLCLNIDVKKDYVYIRLDLPFVGITYYNYKEQP